VDVITFSITTWRLFKLLVAGRNTPQRAERAHIVARSVTRRRRSERQIQGLPADSRRMVYVSESDTGTQNELEMGHLYTIFVKKKKKEKLVRVTSN